MAGYELDLKLIKDILVKVVGGLTGGVVGAVVAGIFTSRGIRTQFRLVGDKPAAGNPQSVGHQIKQDYLKKYILYRLVSHLNILG